MIQAADSRSALVGRQLRITKQREAIMELLLHSYEPLTAEDIFLNLHAQDTSVCLATIYRNLTLLSNKGLTTKLISADDGKTRFTLAGREHLHQLVCTSCHRRIDLPDCPLEAFERRVKTQTSYTMLSHQLELYGLCPDCTVYPPDAAIAKKTPADR